MDVGTIVGGKYRLSRALGEGSMGSVWAAVHEVLGREVAIKFLRQSFEDANTAAARFAAEARAAALVKHRFVVDVFDFGVTDTGASYMVQELLQGRPLSELLTDGPAWSARDAVRFMMDCLSGLSAVHERGIVHRDLKPENIFVIPDVEGSFPKLLDFGISKSADPGRERTPKRPSLRAPGKGRLTAFGATLGTPAYMSPEQLRNLSSLDARADLYSLGVVFYEWLAGHCPYASNSNFAELVEQIESRSMTLLEELRPDIGPELCAVVTRALDPDREQRYGSALEMRSALAQTLSLLPEASTRVQRETQPSVRLPPLRMPDFDLPPAVPPPPPSKKWGREGSHPYELPPIQLRAVAQPSQAPLSIAPAGLRKAPSWKFWSAAAVVCGLAIGTAIALRSVSVHSPPRVQAASKAPPVVMELRPLQEPALQDGELPHGELPPDNAPDQELAAPAVPEAPRRRAHAARPEPTAQPAPPAPRAAPPEPKPAAESAPEGGKLLRSLDF
ncbi:MAG TPA: protein kinase [Polyangiales bacterium]|nr:protein kinase [Polyangiales bacterium]